MRLPNKVQRSPEYSAGNRSGVQIRRVVVAATVCAGLNCVVTCSSSAGATAPRHCPSYSIPTLREPSVNHLRILRLVFHDCRDIRTKYLGIFAMIGNSIPEYIFIRVCILCLRLVAPLGITYTFASWHAGRFLFSRWIGFYAIAEASFYLFVYLPRSRWLQQVSNICQEQWKACSVCCIQWSLSVYIVEQIYLGICSSLESKEIETLALERIFYQDKLTQSLTVCFTSASSI